MSEKKSLLDITLFEDETIFDYIAQGYFGTGNSRWHDIRCLIGFHNWWARQGHYRVCTRCHTIQRGIKANYGIGNLVVIYAFIMAGIIGFGVWVLNTSFIVLIFLIFLQLIVVVAYLIYLVTKIRRRPEFV